MPFENKVTQFVKDVQASGVAGRERELGLLFLSITSRFLDEPVSVVIKGQSSTGKSFLVDSVLGFFPEDAYVRRSSISEKALAYTPESLEHRVLVIVEADGVANSYLLRTLLSEGEIIHEATTIDDHGQRTTQTVRKEGPTGLIATTTMAQLAHDNETRVVSVELDDSRHVLLASLRAGADAASSGPVALDEVKRCVDAWKQAHEEIAELGSHEVVIPFAPRIVDFIEDVPVSLADRLKRDVPKLYSLIRASALVHHDVREQDEHGRLVATVEDYEVALWVAEPYLVQSAALEVPEQVRAVVEAVKHLLATPPEEAPWVSQIDLCGELSWDKWKVSRWVRKAKEAGYLKDLEQHPESRGSKLVLGEALPGGDTKLFPSAEWLRENT